MVTLWSSLLSAVAMYLASPEIAHAATALAVFESFVLNLFSPVRVFYTKTAGHLPTWPVTAHSLLPFVFTFIDMISLV